jgi:hypothetical protein
MRTEAREYVNPANCFEKISEQVKFYAIDEAEAIEGVAKARVSLIKFDYAAALLEFVRINAPAGAISRKELREISDMIGSGSSNYDWPLCDEVSECVITCLLGNVDRFNKSTDDAIARLEQIVDSI